ncbi:unnamed protein product [Caenorhabditis sp. 36 PRJEB53466]|nr:unnamed protein product [Caenorhabditis sp. 36 PRJEB53466]
MASYACVSLPPQFITPPPSTSNSAQHNNDSDCGSSTGTGRGAMNGHEVSDDGSTSPQPTPPEYPSPPPPSNSPPESMTSLQAESPTGDETILPDTEGTPPSDTETESRPPPTEGTSAGTANPESNVHVWMAQHGFHAVPFQGALPNEPHSILFVHVNDGQQLQLEVKNEEEAVDLLGPGTVRLIGEAGMTNQPLQLQLRLNQQCHQFVDEEVPQVIGVDQLMNALGVQPHRGNSRGGYGHRGGGGGNRGNRHGSGNDQTTRGGHQNRGRGNFRGKSSGRGRDYHQAQVPRINNFANHVPEEAPHQVAEFNGIQPTIDYNAPPPMVDYSNPPPSMAEYNRVQPVVEYNGVANGPVGFTQEIIEVIPPNQNQNMGPGGQISLLGEPTGPPLMDMALAMPMVSMMNAPPPGFQPIAPSGMQLMLGGPIENQATDMSVMPTMFNGPMMPPGMLQDQMMPGPSMAVTQPMFGMPPPGLLLLPHNGLNFHNNNKWIADSAAEETEAIRQIFSLKLKPPTVANVLPTEAEFLWVPLKIFNHQYRKNGALYPCVDDKEISYYAFVFNSEGRCIITELMTPNNTDQAMKGSIFKAHNLYPNRNYQIRISACLVSRNIHGEMSSVVSFRTAPGRPDPPTSADVKVRGPNFFELCWNESCNNGAFVSLYNVYIYENECGNGRMLRTKETDVRVEGLKPDTCYKISICAINALGESLVGHRFDAWTDPVRAPLPPRNVSASAISHRSIEVNWDLNQNCYYSIEMYDSFKKTSAIVREGMGSNTAILGELASDTEYRIRITARNSKGETKSSWVSARTQPYRKPDYRYREDSFNRQLRPNCDRPPSPPSCEPTHGGHPEFRWKGFGPNQGSHIYALEGSTYDEPQNFLLLYRGSATSFVVTDESLHYLRLHVIYKKGQLSPYSDLAIIPREYGKYRPDCVHMVRIRMTTDGCLAVEWDSINTENGRYPVKVVARYQIQRTDLSDTPIISVDENTSHVFDDIPADTMISVSVRSTIYFHGSFLPGDWSIPVSFKIPGSLPPVVTNILFNLETSLLSWESLDQSGVLPYTVGVINLQTGKSVLRITTTRRNIIVDAVEPGCSYLATVTTFTNFGRSAHDTTLEFCIPALVPTTPVETVVTEIGMNWCILEWEESQPNGSEITGYIVKMTEEGKYTRNKEVPVGSASGYMVKLKPLAPNTKYQFQVVAKSKIGNSEPAIINIRTHPLPPVPPKMECDRESSALKLRWQRITTSEDIVYKVTRLNENGQQQSVYEGENNTFKVKGLTEDTEYSFQVKVTDRNTGSSAVSESYIFRTTIAPPPPMKHAVVSSLVPGTSYTYHVEWRNALPANSPYRLFYRLQVADATVPGARWTMAYEGTATSFDLDTEQFSGALHIRVLCVRVLEGDEELKGSPSPVGYIANEPPAPDPDAAPQNSRRQELFALFRETIRPFGFMIVMIAVVLSLMFTSEVLFRRISEVDSSVSNVNSVPSSTSYLPPGVPRGPPSGP